MVLGCRCLPQKCPDIYDIVVSQEQKLALLKGNVNPLFNRLLILKKTSDGEVGIAARHDLICEKMLELLVGDKWKTEVANAICKIINNIPDDGPGRGSAIQFCYTLVRAEAGNAINALGRPIRVSWLVEFMVKHSCPGLEKVFRECKEKYFPLEPHLIAHLSRFYYEFTFDYEKARMIMNEALAVDGEDSTINQMMGMTYRREIQKRIRDKCDDFSQLKSLYVVAREWFLAAASYRKDKEDHKAYGGFIQTALDLIRYGLRIKAITINSEDYHDMLSQAREMIEEAKFYLAYDEKTPLGLMEEQIRVFECDADLEKLRELAFGCGAYNGAKLVYGSVCYYDAMSHPANSIKREDFLRSLIKDLELINIRPLSSQLTLLWAKASLRLSNPDLEKIEIELSKITEERLDVQFYLMCTRFMLMLINPNIVSFNAYKKSKASCIRLSELIPWKAMRREAIGVNMNLITHKEDRDFDQSGEINDLIVLRVNRYEVRPFAGFQEAILALRPKDPTQYIVEGDRVKGSIGFTFVGPRLYAYERA